MPFMFFLYGVSVQMLGNNVMALWMKSEGFSVIEMNRYPTAIFACAILGTVGYSVLSDKLGSRWQASIAIGFTFTLSCSLLLSDSVPVPGKFFAFYALGTCLAPQALWFSWCADVTEHDIHLRAVTTGWMNAVVEGSISWWPVVFYPVTDAPLYKKGFTASLILGTLIVPTVALVVYLEAKQKRELASASQSLMEPSEEETPLIIST
jgi:ACS family pantothenate transporter-like MFS transporter